MGLSGEDPALVSQLLLAGVSGEMWVLQGHGCCVSGLTAVRWPSPEPCEVVAPLRYLKVDARV